tara:strand:+ start:851 stop:1642 length:792 start_codon:yes stop_codon:yes gene_type:complete
MSTSLNSTTTRNISNNSGSDLSKPQRSLLANSNDSPEATTINNFEDTSITTLELIQKILLENRDAIFDDVLVNGLLTTNCLSVSNQLGIGDSQETDNKQILQIVTKDIYPLNIPDQVISDITYETINDISLSLIAQSSNALYKLNVTFNYLTSTYYNTFLKIGIFYYVINTDLNTTSEHKLIAEEIIGNENANFTQGVFSKTIFINILHDVDNIIIFYLKGKIQTDSIGNDFNYSDVENTLKPSIIQTISGNHITLTEFGKYS